MKTDIANKIMNGTFGTVWVNNEKWQDIKAFEAKATGEYEDVNVQGVLGKSRKYIGFEGAGSITTHKVYSRGAKIIGDAFKTGIMPDIKIISKLDDPAAFGAERVVYYGVTFDEITLSKFEGKTPGEEELPFKFVDYEFKDLV